MELSGKRPLVAPRVVLRVDRDTGRQTTAVRPNGDGRRVGVRHGERKTHAHWVGETIIPDLPQGGLRVRLRD